MLLRYHFYQPVGIKYKTPPHYPGQNSKQNPYLGLLKGCASVFL